MSDFAIKASFSARQFVYTIFPFNEISIETDVLRVSFSTDRLASTEFMNFVLFCFYSVEATDR